MVKSEFLTSLDARQLDDENSYLLSDLKYRSELLGGILTVPKGFVNDRSSTPRVPLIYTLYGGRSHHEGVCHDFLYRVKDHKVTIEKEDGTIKELVVSKSLADKVFFEAMVARDKSFGIRWGMYLGVKFGGYSSWKTGNERFKIILIDN